MDEAKSILMDLPGKLKINKDQPSENKQRLFVQNLLSQESAAIICVKQRLNNKQWSGGNIKKVKL